MITIFRSPLPLLLILGIAAHGSVLWAHFHSMWESTSFRFFPLAIGLALYVAYHRKSSLARWMSSSSREANNEDVASLDSSGKNSIVLIGCLLLSVLTAILTSILAMPILGWFSFLFFLSVLVYAGYGAKGLLAFWPSIVILAMVRFIPDSTDEYVKIGLQKVTSTLASVLMDAIGLVHLREGAMLALTRPAFEAEEACSGIRSLYSIFTVTFAWNILHRYGWIRHVFNLVQAFMWVILLNAFKLVAILVFHHKNWLNIAEGVPLEIATIVTFVGIAAMILSTDQLVSFFLTKNDSLDHDGKPIISKAYSTKPDIAVPKWQLASASAVLWMIGLGVAASISTRLLTISAVDQAEIVRQLSPTKESLGSQIEGWTVVDYSLAKHNPSHLLGKNTYQWTLRKGMQQVMLSLDEDVSANRTPQFYLASRGWTCDTINPGLLSNDPSLRLTSVVAAGDTPATANQPDLVAQEGQADAANASLVRLRRGKSDSGVVLFTILDSFGQPIQERPTDNLLSSRFWTTQFAIGMARLIGGSESANAPKVNDQRSRILLRLAYIPNIEMKSEDIEYLAEFFPLCLSQLQKSAVFGQNP